MKNWLIFITVFLLSLTLVISILVIWKADEPFDEIEKQASDLAISSDHLKFVSDGYVYNGNEPYITLFGEDEQGKKKQFLFLTT